MRKKKNPMLILGLVLVLLVAVYFGLRGWNKNQEEKQAEKEEAGTVYVTDIGEITRIRYDIGNGDVTFVKENGNWVLEEDKDFPLAQSYPEQIAENFGKLKATRELKDGDSLDAYGLSEPAYIVVLTDSDGKETTVYYGDMVGEEYYVTVDGTDIVYTVDNSSVSDLQHELADMAQLDSYPSIGSGNLKKEVIRKNDGSEIIYDLENEDDTENIAAVAGGLGVVTLSSVADYSVSDEDMVGFGLGEDIRTVVEATYTSDGEEEMLTLYIGNTDGNGNRYVMLNESRIVYLISEEVCGNILNEE